jgi:hypothetical protein
MEKNNEHKKKTRCSKQRVNPTYAKENENQSENQPTRRSINMNNSTAQNHKTQLTHKDFEVLARSFITPELAEQAAIFRVDDLEGSEIVGGKRSADIDYSGIVFSYFFPEITSRRECRLRRDNPGLDASVDGTTKEKGKYLSPPGRGNMLYFPPDCLNEFLADVSLPVVITEGEKKTLALHRASWHGLTESGDKPRFQTIGLSGVWNFRGTIGKTTSAGGGRQDVKGTIPDFQLIEWKNRKAIILFDANVSTNESVKFARLTLAKNLKELGADVYLADCPEMNGCNGIDDVLGKIEREQSTDAAVKECQGILKAAVAFKAEKVSQANQLLTLADDIELFHTSDRTAFASIEVNEHKEIHPVNSKSFRDYLSYQFYQEDGKAPSSQALQDAINSLSGKAKFEGETQDVNIRLASFNGKIYLDLCNDEWQILEIDADGHRVIEARNAPVFFRRTKAMQALPTPTEGGDISKLKDFLNVDDKNLTLILAWLVNCFRPDYPFPILLISGEQGTAKSTASKVCRELVDPSIAPFRSAPRDERDLIIAATNAWICAFDNLSSVPNSLSDGFCRIATGGSLATRTLYSDDEETIFTAKRPIILNGIGDIASRGDLLDRALLVKLEAIPKDKRKTEREFWAEFEKERTSIFSALITAVSLALKNIEDTSLAELPRMADFALWATAAETGLGLKKDAFMKHYTQNREDAHSIVLEDSPIFEALQKICKKQSDFDGTLKEFLELIDSFTDEKTQKSKAYPKTARGLRSHLERINPNLRQLEINITFPRRTKAGSSVLLEYGCKQPSQPSQPTPPAQNNAQNGDGRVTVAIPTVTRLNTNDSNGLMAKGDGRDGCDGHLHLYSNDGETVIEDFYNCLHCSADIPLADEVCPGCEKAQFQAF